MHCHRLIVERRPKRSNTAMAHLLSHFFAGHSRTLTSTACRILKDIVILQFPTNEGVISSHPTKIFLYCYFQLTRGGISFHPTKILLYCYFQEVSMGYFVPPHKRLPVIRTVSPNQNAFRAKRPTSGRHVWPRAVA